MSTSPPYNALDLEDVFAYVDEHRQEFIERLIDYVRRPSISAYGEGIRGVAEYIAGILNRLGVQARILPTAGWPMVLAQRADAQAPPLALIKQHRQRAQRRLRRAGR